VGGADPPDLGAQIVAVSNAGGAVRSPRGIDAGALRAHLDGGGKLREFPDVEPITHTELLETECELLVPAALGGMIHAGNADRLGCRIVVEGANSPLTPTADAILHDRGIHVVPDIVANAGGAWSPTSSGCRTCSTSAGTSAR
jgi:glutamate dehydrogenase (NAD(P)+)